VQLWRYQFMTISVNILLYFYSSTVLKYWLYELLKYLKKNMNRVIDQPSKLMLEHIIRVQVSVQIWDS